MLIDASPRDAVVNEAMLQRPLAALGQSVALSRLGREAERLLDVARSTGAGVGQLSFAPRAMTTGSWHQTILRCR